MAVLTIKISQYVANIEHEPVIDFSFVIEDGTGRITIAERDKNETFARVMNLLYVTYPNRTFKISKPMRVDFFLNKDPIGSYLPKRLKKDLNNKFKNKIRSQIKECEYVLIEYLDNYKRHKTKEDGIKRKEKQSYLSLNKLINSKAFKEQKLPKYWRAEISTPMYS